MSHAHEPFLAAADTIGAQLCRDALWAGRRCNWLGASMEVIDGAWKTAQRTFGPELYSGTSGIALFLGRLYQRVPERIYRQTALGAIRHALSRLEDLPRTTLASFYSGTVGIAYVCHTLASLLDEPQLARQATELLRQLPSGDLADHSIDVLTGYAGAIPALLDLGRKGSRQQLVERALEYGQHLLASARRSAHGWSWDTMRAPGQQHDLLGFSHGAAGIAWSLLELYHVTGDERFRHGAEQALAYERHWFSPQQGNWPDLRSFQESTGDASQPGFMVAWCHGASGIGLARLRAYQILGDAACREEAIIAVQTTARMLEQAMASDGASFCLCHGLAGNADLLLYASQVLADSGPAALAEQVGLHGIECYQASRTAWPCGVIGAGETPGLFLGLAGIGYFYLRLAEPARVPPITILLPDHSPDAAT
ncbi:MAG TPA: type 2 lanthipeptide synthetase LanM [Roseiflexaceae bacterium]|nr:type 2 lanthipeptide synthetase LanM [Roseiflexaceae bacterium]